jgi:hypothetical protein
MREKPFMRDVEFCVVLHYGDGTDADAQAFVDLSREEYELLLRCCREGRSPCSEEGLRGVVYRAENYVVYSLSLYSANDNIGMPGGLENLSLEVLIPRKIREAVQREAEGAGEDEL